MSVHYDKGDSVELEKVGIETEIALPLKRKAAFVVKRLSAAQHPHYLSSLGNALQQAWVYNARLAHPFSTYEEASDAIDSLDIEQGVYEVVQVFVKA